MMAVSKLLFNDVLYMFLFVSHFAQYVIQSVTLAISAVVAWPRCDLSELTVNAAGFDVVLAVNWR